MAARFGDMLVEQRRRLGLSIQQVANTIKIRPQIIEFFETGNFASMPPRGYAQGMISSYARFLGLNPREVVNAYFDDLMAYEHETSQRGGRFQEAAGYVNARSSTDKGRFLMVEGGRSSRYGQRPPQAGYVTENGSGADIREQRDRFRNTLPPADSALPASRGNVRNPRVGYGDGGYQSRSRYDRTAGSDGYRQNGPGRTASGSRNGSYGYDRSLSQHDNRGRVGDTRRAGSSRAYGSRPNGRTTSGYRQGGGDPRIARNGRGSRAPQPSGPMADPRFMYAVFGVIAVLIILVIVLLFRGCTPAKQQETKPAVTRAAVASGSTETSSKKSSKDDSSDSDASDSSDSSDSSSEKSSSKSKTSKVTKVKVKVAKGKTAWIEVKVDGKSVYGAQATGPFEQEYTPESSIEITTSKPSDVTVTKNGEKVRYDTKTSGVARVTITVPKKQSSSSDSSKASDSTDSSDGTTDAQSSDGTDGTDATGTASSSDDSSSQDYSSSSSYQTYSTQ